MMNMLKNPICDQVATGANSCREKPTVAKFATFHLNWLQDLRGQDSRWGFAQWNSFIVPEGFFSCRCSPRFHHVQWLVLGGFYCRTRPPAELSTISIEQAKDRIALVEAVPSVTVTVSARSRLRGTSQKYIGVLSHYITISTRPPRFSLSLVGGCLFIFTCRRYGVPNHHTSITAVRRKITKLLQWSQNWKS